MLKQQISEVVEKNFKKGRPAETINKFLAIINNDNFKRDAQFLENYNSTLRETLTILKNVILNTKPQEENKEILTITHYINVSLNPYQTFDCKDFDFNKFYEDSEYIPY